MGLKKVVYSTFCRTIYNKIVRYLQIPADSCKFILGIFTAAILITCACLPYVPKINTVAIRPSWYLMRVKIGRLIIQYQTSYFETNLWQHYVQSFMFVFNNIKKTLKKLETRQSSFNFDLLFTRPQKHIANKGRFGQRGRLMLSAHP